VWSETLKRIRHRRPALIQHRHNSPKTGLLLLAWRGQAIVQKFGTFHSAKEKSKFERVSCDFARTAETIEEHACKIARTRHRMAPKAK
jgi:hypothetical protein